MWQYTIGVRGHSVRITGIPYHEVFSGAAWRPRQYAALPHMKNPDLGVRMTTQQPFGRGIIISVGIIHPRLHVDRHELAMVSRSKVRADIAGAHLLSEARARHERTLEAVWRFVRPGFCEADYPSIGSLYAAKLSISRIMPRSHSSSAWR